ncbi:hypothetical protein [Sandaracinus amylolyticus]|uniref:Uncharacterized protein n=1 Tax=Sandaracinus amylolyticus TaxID=927083 RepID=A0A0F6W6I4_9BACT|nr:hypothetical protein [Sandaracinus amylolyticus]AKF08673.1 hypothetical protein DB32_005822 [Sandaracinus amylolyticus]
MIIQGTPDRDDQGPYIDLEHPAGITSAQALGATVAIFLDAEGHEVSRQRPGRTFPTPREVSRVRFVEREPGAVSVVIVATAKEPVSIGPRIVAPAWED